MPEHDHIHVEINTGTIIRTVLVILFFVFLYILKDVFIIFLFAIIIASAISSTVNFAIDFPHDGQNASPMRTKHANGLD